MQQWCQFVQFLECLLLCPSHTWKERERCNLSHQAVQHSTYDLRLNSWADLSTQHSLFFALNQILVFLYKNYSCPDGKTPPESYRCELLRLWNLIKRLCWLLSDESQGSGLQSVCYWTEDLELRTEEQLNRNVLNPTTHHPPPTHVIIRRPIDSLDWKELISVHLIVWGCEKCWNIPAGSYMSWVIVIMVCVSLPVLYRPVPTHLLSVCLYSETAVSCQSNTLTPLSSLPAKPGLAQVIL